MALSLNNIGSSLFGGDPTVLKNINEKKSSELGRLNNRIDSGITGLSKGGQLTQDLLQRKGQERIGDISTQGQGALTNAADNAALRGAGNPSFFNRLSTLNNLNTAKQQGQAAGDTFDALSKSAIGDFANQQGFLDKASLFTANLGQGIEARNASNQLETARRNAALKAQADADLGFFGNRLLADANNIGEGFSKGLGSFFSGGGGGLFG